MPSTPAVRELVDVDRLVVAALQLLDDALLQLAGLLRASVCARRAEAHGVLAVQVPAGEVAAEEPEGDEEDDDDGAEGAHQS